MGGGGLNNMPKPGDYRKVYIARKSGVLDSIKSAAEDAYNKYAPEVKEAVSTLAQAASPETLGPRLLQRAGEEVKEALGGKN